MPPADIEDAPIAARKAYTRTKAAGEWAMRTASLYGAHGPNFVKTMARLAAER